MNFKNLSVKVLYISEQHNMLVYYCILCR